MSNLIALLTEEGLTKKEAWLKEVVGFEPYIRKPLLCYAFDPELYPDDLHECVGSKLDKEKSDVKPWIEEHPFLFSLCLVRRFYEKSDGLKYNLFKGKSINAVLYASVGGVFHGFDSNCDRRFNFHKVLAEAFFFFGAKTSQYYGVLSQIREEFNRVENIDDAYRTMLNEEVAFPFAYDHLLQNKVQLFRELLCGYHTENPILQELTSEYLSEKLRDSSASINWSISWSSKKLDISIDRLVLSCSNVPKLTVKDCDESCHTFPLEKLRYVIKGNKYQFPLIRVSELFEQLLSLQLGCEISFGRSLSESVGALFSDDLPIIFRKVGDIACLWIPSSKSKEEVVRASELVLVKRIEKTQSVMHGDKKLSLDRKTVSFEDERYDAVLVQVNQLQGELAYPFVVDGKQICRVGVRPRFEVVDEMNPVQSREGDLFAVGEEINLHLNSKENFDERSVTVEGCKFSVSMNCITLIGVSKGALVEVLYGKIRNRILRLPDRHDQVACNPMLAVEGLWEPNESVWGSPGKTLGELCVGTKRYKAWVPWTNLRFAWKKIGIGQKWEFCAEKLFFSLSELKEYCLELWLPCQATLKLNDVALSDCAEGLNTIRFDNPEIGLKLKKCFKNAASLGSDSPLRCQLPDGSYQQVAEVVLEPNSPILLKKESNGFIVYIPGNYETEDWNVCVLDERRIAKPIEWLDIKHGRNDFGVGNIGQCCWVVLCEGRDWKTNWLDFLVQAAGRKPVEVLPFVPKQRAPLRDRLLGVEKVGEQLGIIKGLLAQFDVTLFQETLADADSIESGVCVSRIPRIVARQMFCENLTLESIEMKVEQLLRAGFNVFSIRSKYMDWIQNICGRWTQGERGTASKLWQKCAWFPAMELFRNRFPLLGMHSFAWKYFYMGVGYCNQQYLKREFNDYFPSNKISILIHEQQRVLDIEYIEESLGKIRIKDINEKFSRPVYFWFWRKTVQLKYCESSFSLQNILTDGIYPIMSEEPYEEKDYKQNKDAEMYLSNKMYRCALYEACIAVQLVFAFDVLEYLYELLLLDLSECIGRDKVLNEILTRCYEKYQEDKGYANRVAVLVLAVFSRRRYPFSDKNHQLFMEGLLRAYRTCRRLLMNDLIAVEFFRVWFSQRLGVVNESS